MKDSSFWILMLICLGLLGLACRESYWAGRYSVVVDQKAKLEKESTRWEAKFDACEQSLFSCEHETFPVAP